MKFLHTKFIALFLLLALNGKAVNDTLTIGQAFDWSVGDTLLYQEYDYEAGQNITAHYYNLSAIYGFEVIEKNITTDSVIYYLHWINGSDDTVIFSNIHNTIDKFSYSVLYPKLNGCSMLRNSPSSDSANFRSAINLTNWPVSIDSLKKTDVSFSALDQGFGGLFFEKIGVFRFEYVTWQGAPHWEFHCGIWLTYYSSGGARIYSGIVKSNAAPSFRFFPNPASNELTVSAQTDSHTPLTVNIYNITGACMRTVQNVCSGIIHLSTAELPPGYYLLKLSDGNSFSASKGFVVAR